MLRNWSLSPWCGHTMRNLKSFGRTGPVSADISNAGWWDGVYSTSQARCSYREKHNCKWNVTLRTNHILVRVLKVLQVRFSLWNVKNTQNPIHLHRKWNDHVFSIHLPGLEIKGGYSGNSRTLHWFKINVSHGIDPWNRQHVIKGSTNWSKVYKTTWI